MKKVIVCKSALLLNSETFIREQVRAYSSWSSVLVGTHRVESGVSLDGLNARFLLTSSPTVLSRVYRRLLRELRIALPFAVGNLRREAASLVHVHFGTDAVEYWPTIRRLSLPVVVTLHGYDINIHREWWERQSPRFEDRRYPKRLLAIAKQPQVFFVAVSEAIKQRAIEYGIPADRIFVRYIGIDVSRFRLSGEPVSRRRRRVLYVGRFVEKKGGEYLIRAFARVRSSIPDAQLTMVGDGPMARHFAQIAAELAVPVEFPGRLSSDEVREQIEQARVFCLPSVTALNGDAEGLPISILEAQACGVPVVTSARGGATEGILDGVTGFAFPERDTGALGRHMARLLSDDELVDSMSTAAIANVREKFDIRACTRSLEMLYEKLAEVPVRCRKVR